MPRSYVKKTAARALKGKSQVLSSNNDVEYIVDEFDTSLSINIETDICVFCKRGQEEGIRLREKSHFQDIPVDLDGEELNPDDIDDWMLTYRNAGQKKQYSIDQIWISKYSIHYTGRKVFAHFICAYFSPLVWYDGIAWKNVRREYIRGQSLSCKLCGLKGATLRCIDKKCHSCFHIPCAIEIGFGGGTHGIMKTDKFMCIEHKQQQLAEKQQLDRVASKDISRGQESTPIYVKNTVDTSQPQQFHYITNNCDSDDAIATSQNFSQIACCDCTGLCNDIQTCACIQIQRNYTNFEVLIAGNSNPILECNLRCACSMRRCTNRVVGRGIKPELEITRGFASLHQAAAVISPNQVSKPTVSSKAKLSLLFMDYTDPLLESTDMITDGDVLVDINTSTSSSGTSSSEDSSKNTVSVVSTNSLQEATDNVLPSRTEVLQPILSQEYSVHVSNKRAKMEINEVQFWSVRTMSDIPMGRYVCEMNGQYLKGSSSAGIIPSTYQPFTFDDITGLVTTATATATATATDSTIQHTIVDEFLHQLLRNETLTVFPLCTWELIDWSLDTIYQLAIKTTDTRAKAEIRFRQTEDLKSKVGTPIQPGETFIIDDASEPGVGIEDICIPLQSSNQATNVDTNGSSSNGGSSSTYHNDHSMLSVSHPNSQSEHSNTIQSPLLPLTVAITLANHKAEPHLLSSASVFTKEKIVTCHQFLINEIFLDCRTYSNVSRFIRQSSNTSVLGFRLSIDTKTEQKIAVAQLEIQRRQVGKDNNVNLSNTMNIHDNTYHTNGNSSPLLTKPYFNASMNLHTDRAINGITNNRSQLDDESEQLSIHPVSMLIRKLVYNDKANLLFPKLVMFAKCDISAHSELIL